MRGVSGVLLVGYSHLHALMRAYQQRVREKRDGIFELDSLEFEPHGRHQPTAVETKDSLVSYQRIQEDMGKLIAVSKPALIVASLWGNQHFFLSVSKGPRPYDFVLPGEPERELSEGAELIPYDLVHSFVASLCAKAYEAPLFFRKFTSLPIVSVSAPPPVEHVLEIAGGTSSEALDASVKEFGLASATLRYKFWKVCEQIFRKKSIEQGVPFVPVPAESVDSNGFRYREYYGQDWIHASTSYGELVLCQVDKLRKRG
jgi:hypothetical protein